MNLADDYLELAQRLLSPGDIPRPSRLYFPAISKNPEPGPVAGDTNKEDDFGFVILEDGSAGPFYTSFGDSLEYLHQHFPEPLHPRQTTRDLISGFASPQIALRALALGAFNALSQHLIRRSGYQPPTTKNSAGLDRLETGERIGMVGYFCPLVDKLLARGLQIQIIEKNPQRVELQPGLQLSTLASDLAGCRQIICTASVLINNSLDEILQASTDASACHLIGPSGSGLPDIVFKRGVASMGGIIFNSPAALFERLDEAVNWGDAGQKYQLTPVNYPGVESLLLRA